MKFQKDLKTFDQITKIYVFSSHSNVGKSPVPNGFFEMFTIEDGIGVFGGI